MVINSCPPYLLQSMTSFLLSSSTVAPQAGLLGTALMSRWCLNRVEVAGSQTGRLALARSVQV